MERYPHCTSRLGCHIYIYDQELNWSDNSPECLGMTDPGDRGQPLETEIRDLQQGATEVSPSTENRLRPSEIAERGEAIYQQHKGEFEGRYSGQYVAINVTDGRYAIGPTGLEAIDKARKMCDNLFVGYLRGGGFVESFGNI